MKVPDGYKYSESELLAPLVRAFHEMVGRDLTDEEILALDFALEWTQETAVSNYEKGMTTEWSVMYGIPPMLKFLEVPTEAVAKRVASALQGQVRFRKITKWEKL